MTDVVIIGAGGHGREVHDVLLDDGSSNMLGFLDDHEPDTELMGRIGASWLGPVGEMSSLPRTVQFLVGLGSGTARRIMDRRAVEAGFEPYTLVHPRASVGRDVRLAPGVVVFAHATVTTNITLGRHTHIGRGVAVGHDAALGGYVSAYPNSAISGNVTLEDEVTIGTTACVLQGLTIGAGTFVGAGAVVTKSQPGGQTVVGCPARPTERRPPGSV